MESASTTARLITLLLSFREVYAGALTTRLGLLPLSAIAMRVAQELTPKNAAIQRGIFSDTWL